MILQVITSLTECDDNILPSTGHASTTTTNNNNNSNKRKKRKKESGLVLHLIFHRFDRLIVVKSRLVAVLPIPTMPAGPPVFPDWPTAASSVTHSRSQHSATPRTSSPRPWLTTTRERACSEIDHPVSGKSINSHLFFC